jgi:hypothetical protein
VRVSCAQEPERARQRGEHGWEIRLSLSDFDFVQNVRLNERRTAVLTQTVLFRFRFSAIEIVRFAVQKDVE